MRSLLGKAFNVLYINIYMAICSWPHTFPSFFWFERSDVWNYSNLLTIVRERQRIARFLAWISEVVACHLVSYVRKITLSV